MSKTDQPKEVLTSGHLKGGIFRSHLQWVRDHHRDDLPRVLERLSPEPRKALSGTVLATSWFPFAWLIELDRILLDIFGATHPNLLRELGSYSATINLSTTYKLLDRKANHEFFRNSALLHVQFQDFGKAAYEQTGETSGRMIHKEYPSYSTIYCGSALGYYEGCVASHGGGSPRAVEISCQCFGDDSCTFDISWT